MTTPDATHPTPLREALDKAAAAIDDPAQYTYTDPKYRAGWVDALRAVRDDPAIAAAEAVIALATPRPEAGELRRRASRVFEAVGAPCPSGHPFEEVNVYRHRTGRMECRVCRREDKRRFRQTPAGKLAAQRARANSRSPSPEDVDARFWLRVDRRGPHECWEWLGPRNYGYGQFAASHRVTLRAHRYAYETLVGPVPEGLQLDHLCRNRGCVNPAHLEAVTNRENTLRGFRARRAGGVA